MILVIKIRLRFLEQMDTLLVKKLETGHYLAIKVHNDVNLGKVRATFHESANRLVALLQ